jgi:hypothetical protein
MIILNHNLDIKLSALYKDINVLKNLLTETYTVLNRKNIAIFKDKVIDTIHELGYGELFNNKSEFERLMLDQFDILSKTNDVTISYITKLLESKEQVFNYTLGLVQTRVEFKLQVAAGKNYTYDPVLISYLQDDQKLVDKIKNLLHRHTDFKYPGLLLGQDNLELSKNIVSNDPLFVCLPEQDSTSFGTYFNPIYNNSIRKYYFTNNCTDVLATLPQNQFGLSVSSVHIDTIPDAMIVNYFSIIKDLLRQGGSLIFVFFNYDSYKSLQLVEQITDFGKTLMDSATILPAVRSYDDYKRIIESLGLQIEMFVPGNTHNLLMVSKDGELKTVKAKKVIGEIIAV